MVHALIGMKRGEERLVYIHPRYGYGDHSFMSPNSTLIVNVQFLDFEEGDREIAILPPHKLEMKNVKELQAQLEALKFKEYNENGRRLWHAVKKTGDFIDFQIVKKAIEEILTTDRKPTFISLKEAHEYGVGLQHFLLSQKNKQTMDSRKSQLQNAASQKNQS